MGDTGKSVVIAENFQSILWARFDGHPRIGVITKRKSHGYNSSDSVEGLPGLQTYFCKLFPNLFTRIGKILNAKVKAEFFDPLKPIQETGRRVPISLQDKVEEEIARLINEGHIINL